MDAAGTDTGAKGPRLAKGLSEFLAKVLDQLLLSSWLPSAALVIGGAYLFAIRAELDAPSACISDECTWAQTLTEAGARLSNMSLGGAVVILAVIVVITMLTQAFTFEAIRHLEGYWGANRFMRWLGRCGARWHRSRRDNLTEQLSELRKQMRDGAFATIRARNSEQAMRGKPLLLGPGELEVLLASLENRTPTVELTEDEFQRSSTFNWKRHADPQLRLEETILVKRLGAYPGSGWVMPTRLGNILRHHEQNMQVADIESFIQDNFDALPPSLQVAHDEERTRMDLYCTLVFLLPGVGLLAAAILLPHFGALVATEVVVIVLTLLAHRAAIASAHAYGSVLESTATAIRAVPTTGSPAGPTATAGGKPPGSA